MMSNNKEQKPVASANAYIPKASVDVNKAIRLLSAWSAWIVVGASIAILAIIAFFISQDMISFAKDYGLYFVANLLCTFAIYVSFFRDGTISGKQEDAFVDNLSLYVAKAKGRRKDKVEKFLAHERIQEKSNYKKLVQDITGMTMEQILACKVREAFKKKDINRVQRRHILNIQNDRYPDTVPKSANRILSALGTRYRKDVMVDLDASKRYTVKSYITKIIMMAVTSAPAGFMALQGAMNNPWAAAIKLFVSIVFMTVSIVGGFSVGFKSVAAIEKETLAELVKLFTNMDEWEAQGLDKEDIKDDERTITTGVVSAEGSTTDRPGETGRPIQQDGFAGDINQPASGGDNSLGQTAGTGVTECTSTTVNQQPVIECSNPIQSVT